MNSKPKLIILFSWLVAALTPFIAQTGKAQNTFEGFQQFTESFQVKTQEAGKSTGFYPLDMNCIRQKGNREFPYPTEGHGIITNPPTFTWPMADYHYPKTFPAPHSGKKIGDYLHYDIQLGRTTDFSDKKTTMRTDLPLAFYNPHKALKAGKWFWRYRVSGGKWSETFSVNIPEGTPLFESPDAEEALRMIPHKHPIIYKHQALSNPTPDQKALLRQLQTKAQIALKKEVKEYKVKGKPIPPHATKSERRQIMRFHLRYEMEAICHSIETLLSAYQTNGNPQYLDKAIHLSDYIAAKDPVQIYATSDFTGAFCMGTLATTIDVAYGKLDGKQKRNYTEFIKKAGSCVLSSALEENIGSADGILCAHFFQHTFSTLFNTSIIMQPHLEEAKEWFTVLYDIWLSRSPGGGFLSDGAWPNGNMAYIHVNMESMVSNYLVFRDLFGVNIFRHPWYVNCANALAYTVPVHSAGDGFGDGSDEPYAPNALRADFAYILGQELDNPFALWYAYERSGQKYGKPYHFQKMFFMSYRLQHHPKQFKATQLAQMKIPQSAVFPQTGIVVMNTDVQRADSNLFVSFRSSPFGVGSHGLAEQNSFNISYKGKPLFYPTGYKITTADKHYLLSHKHSRARNTITVNGKTQAFSHSAYGWIARYLDGNDITYALGDASKAYVPFDSSAVNWITVLKDANAYTSENGFILNEEDNPKVKLFRRHLALLRPRIIVIYDELKAEKPVTWTLQFNGLERANFKLLEHDNRLTADTDNCDAQACVFGSSRISSSLADSSYIRPFDWLNPQRGRPAKKFESRQYHTRFENAEKCKDMRFLTVIQIDESNTMTFSQVLPDAQGTIHIGDYTIRGELDIRREAALEIKNDRTGEKLLYGTGHTDGYERKFTHSTVLYSPQKGWQESIDRHPMMAPSQYTQKR
ncbi:DUF4962 domain-containing protein [Phocaeicola plebeius]|uniref:DUF4962 domain-containing protein n=1 Tax=Phocaeicola plebeius TaxID=310297 RepID=UPI0026F2C325|nr:DUF4962 domain-containing protein [Phocaeicola plebeius]